MTNKQKQELEIMKKNVKVQYNKDFANYPSVKELMDKLSKT